MNELPPEIPHLIQALTRLRVIFQATLDVELMDIEVAELAGLEDDECRILLAVLHQTGAIERPRRRVFVCRRSSWWTAARTRPQPPAPMRIDEGTVGSWDRAVTRVARTASGRTHSTR